MMKTIKMISEIEVERITIPSISKKMLWVIVGLIIMVVIIKF